MESNYKVLNHFLHGIVFKTILEGKDAWFS